MFSKYGFASYRLIITFASKSQFIKTQLTMKKQILAALVLIASTIPLLNAHEINIIPTPKEMTVGNGTFKFSPKTRIAVKGKEAHEAADFFIEKIQKSTGSKLIKGKTQKDDCITFTIDKSIHGKESYKLEVTEHIIIASASTADGLFYAAQSLLQLLPPEVENNQPINNFTTWNIPTVSIADAPRFEYRGVMLDPCRHFLPVSAIKRQIDMLSTYKINRLHWHLTDDQGWRIEIKKYPELVTMGAQRTEGDGSIHKGFYTQEEIKEVVEYARRHHIQVIPELEIPGHELAAITAYPELSCQSDTVTPRIIWGVEDIVMCPGKEKMFSFLQDVIDEMVLLFPSSYFHIGGDESPRGEWANCDKCQQRMKQLGYTKEAQLQSYIIDRIGKYLSQKGKHIIGWDEILEGGNLDSSAIVMSWRGEQGGITAAKAGHRVLMTPSSHGFYFDQYQGDPVTEPTAIGGYSTLQKVYAYNPVPQDLQGSGKEHLVMGVQGNCWSEYIPDASTLEYRLYPRALALAEVAWSPIEKKDFNDFVRRVDSDASLRLQAHHINFHIPQPEIPNASCNRLAFTDEAELPLTSTRPLTIVYTTDGTTPTASSSVYSSPIRLDRSATIRTATILPCGIMSPIRTIYAEKSGFAPASNPEHVENGLNLSIYKGTFLRPFQIPEKADAKKKIDRIEKIRAQTKVPGNVRNVENYAAIADGYIKIPENGIYEFSSNNNQVWIDGKLVIDNSNVNVPRYSRENVQLALAEGYHRIKVIFLGGIFGGWPTYWDNGAVNLRTAGGKWQSTPAEWLFHE